MVEGHQCHRLAHAHRRLLVGKRFEAVSPNGRFADGAAAISGKVLSRIEVHGKNLFYFFGTPVTCLTPPSLITPTPAPLTPVRPVTPIKSSEAKASRTRQPPAKSAVKPARLVETHEPLDPVVVHIHFGMSGAFRTVAMPGPEPSPTCRLQLTHPQAGLVAQLSAMTVAMGGLPLYWDRVSKLGPDPLREDADPERLWGRLQVSKKPVGQALMDQSMVAGLGNIYRAEVLFKSRVHPEQPSNTVTRSVFERLWHHSVTLLQRGFAEGSIITVDKEDAEKLGKPWTRRYVYNQRQCGFCHGPIRTWTMAARTVYCCENCQVLGGGVAADDLDPRRLSAMKESRHARLFKSHCAPDEQQDVPPEKMTVTELRSELLSLNMDMRGNKAVLVARLHDARKWQDKQLVIQEALPPGSSAPISPELPCTPGALLGGREGTQEAAAKSGGSGQEATWNLKAGGTAGLEMEVQVNLAGGGLNGTDSDEEREEGGKRGEKRVGVGGKLGGRAAAPRKSHKRGVPVRKVESSQDESSSDELDHAEELLATNLGVPTRTPTTPAVADLSHLMMSQLRQQLKARGLPLTGTKRELTQRLLDHEGTQAGADESWSPAADCAVLPRPGTAHLGGMAGAKEAALEKLNAGESRAVEHVALHDDETDALVERQASRSKPAAVNPKRRRVVGSP